MKKKLKTMKPMNIKTEEMESFALFVSMLKGEIDYDPRDADQTAAVVRFGARF